MSKDENDTFANSTGIDNFYFFETEQFTLLWILFVVIVAGNVGVLYTLAFGRSRKSRMNYFITHLALADLSVGLIYVLTDIIWKATLEWYAGNFACKLIRFLQGVAIYASTYVLVALSIDRYYAIRHPMKFSGVWKRAKYLILAAWSFSVLYSIPMFIFFEEKIVKGRLQCWIEFTHPWKWQVYMTLGSLSLFIIPAAIIATCYAVIIITIWSKNAKGFIKTTKMTNGSDNSRRASSRGLIPRAKVKTIKITFVIVSVFILCWSPYIIFDLLQVYGKIPYSQTNIAVATFIQSLAPLNSAANPIIYCLFSTHFCRTLRSLPPLKWLFRKKRHEESTTNTQTSSLSNFSTNNIHRRRNENSSSLITAHLELVR